MNALYQVLVAFLGAAILAVLTRYFLARRICIVMQKFPIAQLGNRDEVAVLLTVLNRGYRNEDDVRLELNPKRSYELVAHTAQGVEFKNSVLRIERLPKLEDVAAILIVGNGDFTKADVARASSKEGKGKVYERLEAVPYPPGQAAGVATVLLGLVVLLGWMVLSILQDVAAEKLPAALKPIKQMRMEALASEGWGNVILSDQDERVLENYRVGEFPLQVRIVRREKDIVLVELLAVNRSKLEMEITAAAAEGPRAPNILETDTYWRTNLAPGESNHGLLKIYLPKSIPNARVKLLSTVESADELIAAQRVIKAVEVK